MKIMIPDITSTITTMTMMIGILTITLTGVDMSTTITPTIMRDMVMVAIFIIGSTTTTFADMKGILKDIMAEETMAVDTDREAAMAGDTTAVNSSGLQLFLFV
jgi:hypothetical protein